MSAEFFSQVSTVVHSIWAERWDLFLLSAIARYHKDIAKMVMGGNGHLQVNEAASTLIMLVFYLSFKAEVNRNDLSHSVFSDTYWFATLGSIALLAGIKGYKELISAKVPAAAQPQQNGSRQMEDVRVGEVGMG